MCAHEKKKKSSQITFQVYAETNPLCVLFTVTVIA